MKNILLVDDDLNLRRSLEMGLRSLGYQVVVAGNANEALQAIQQHSFDVVITDVIMPGPSGYVLAQQIQAAQPTLPVILMSACDLQTSLCEQELATGHGGLGAGAQASSTWHKKSAFHVPLISKPFVLSELVNLFELPADTQQVI